MRCALTTLLLLLLTLPLPADVITLKGGRTLEGRIVEESPEAITLETAFGRQTLPRTRIAKVARRPWTPGEARDRLTRVAKDDVQALRAVRAWMDGLPPAEQKKIVAQRRRLARMILKVDPEDAVSRLELGYRKVEGKWLRGRALKQHRARLAAEAAAAERAKREAAARAVREAKEAALYGGATLARQVAANAALDARTATELTRLLGGPCASVTTRRVTVKGLLPREEALTLAGKAELFITASLKAMGLPGSQTLFNRGRNGRFHFYVVSDATMGKAYDKLVPLFVPDWGKATRKLVMENKLDVFPIDKGALGIHRKGNGDLHDVFFHFLGHAMVCSANNGFHPWLIEGFGLYVSEKNVGCMRMTCITISRYAEKRQLRELNAKTFIGLLKHALKHHNDTILDSLTRKPLNSLKLVDIAKAWSLVDYLMRDGRAPKFWAFQRALAQGTPTRVAMRNTLGVDPAGLEAAWKKWFWDKHGEP